MAGWAERGHEGGEYDRHLGWRRGVYECRPSPRARELSLTLNKYRLPRLFSRLPLPAVGATAGRAGDMTERCHVAAAIPGGHESAGSHRSGERACARRGTRTRLSMLVRPCADAPAALLRKATHKATVPSCSAPHLIDTPASRRCSTLCEPRACSCLEISIYYIYAQSLGTGLFLPIHRSKSPGVPDPACAAATSDRPSLTTLDESVGTHDDDDSCEGSPQSRPLVATAVATHCARYNHR